MSTAAVEADLLPSSVPPLTLAASEQDLIGQIPGDIRDVESSINLTEGEVFTPVQVEQALIRLSIRMDRGSVYLDAVERAYSKAKEVHDTAVSKALDRIVYEYEQKSTRPPAEDIRRARVHLATATEREQVRRLEVILSQTKRRIHHLSRQVEVARSLGASVRSSLSAQTGGAA